LYNYLFARRNIGVAVLRIEDTDRSRHVEGATERLIQALHWAGLRFDEGPGIGGQAGPYIQSERTELYRTHAMRLLDEGKAYRCFCTPQELAASRERQTRESKEAAYERTCRTLSEDEVQEKLRMNLPFTIRLKIPLAGQAHFKDIIRGDVSFHFDVIDDQVLLKSDGFPTYHLANVVDDHHMCISHVIRGEEWLPSTAKHVFLYNCFGWTPPSFAHLPLLLNEDRSKLSKRQGDVAVEDFREKGFLPEALINYVALLGWSPGDDREMFSLSELEREFNIERVSKTGAVFDINKLRWFNGQYLRALAPEELVELCIPHLRAAGVDVLDRERLQSIVSLLANRLTLPSDIVPLLHELLLEVSEVNDDEARAYDFDGGAKSVLHRFVELAPGISPWKADHIKALIQTIQHDTEVKGKRLYMPLRIALTGRAHGPDLSIVAEILGRDICMTRIRSHLE